MTRNPDPNRQARRYPKAPEGARERPCLRCSAPMKSTGPHHRLCDPCRHGNGLPPSMQIMGNT